MPSSVNAQHARIQKVLSEGVQLWQRFFFVFVFSLMGGGGGKDPNATISWPSSLVGRWWPNIEFWIGSFVILRGSGPVLLRNPIFFVIFQEGGGLDPLSPLWIRTCSVKRYWVHLEPAPGRNYRFAHSWHKSNSHTKCCQNGHYSFQKGERTRFMTFDKWIDKEDECLFVCLIRFLTSTQQSFSYAGRVFLGWTSTKLG